ncbi:MAG: N-acetyl-gamma-glutamyl-phosphate reductase [Clostridia bacterium]|nr:N-acetyl-gamma-glutamyl-phosphate reductase [Clostridia bacterium]
MTKVFIDGREGTTGLRIYERLTGREDIELILIDEAKRKDPQARKECLNQADIAILCLPDAAAQESVSLIDQPNTRVLDTSTAHRTLADWAYGFPELSPEHLKAIQRGKRVAVPGCHASGFIALAYPLVQEGLVSSEEGLYCHSITGYSGGGKKMIAQYEAQGRDIELDSPRQYGLTQQHKHLKEMAAISGLKELPIFCPIVSDFYSGMLVTVPLWGKGKGLTVEKLRSLYAEHYANQPFIHVYTEEETQALGGFAAGNSLSQRDGMEIIISGNDDRILTMARFDNLGKGSSGAAVQCLNLMMGVPMTTGLAL